MTAQKRKTTSYNFSIALGLLLGLIVLACLALTSAAPVVVQGAGPVCYPPPHNMVGWWDAEGNAKDISGNDHDGTLTDADATFAPGEVGQAFSFDGVDDYVDIPNKGDLNPSVITVDAWIYVTSSNLFGQFYPSIIGKGNVGNFAESYALYLDTSGGVDFLVNTTGQPDGLGRATAFGSTITPDAWNFVAGTYDGSTVNVYVNGVAGIPSLHPGAINATPNDLLIGKADRTSSGYPDSYFNGRIDEVELFSRALSSSEIQGIYNAGTAGKCKCQEKPVEVEGDGNNIDGSKSKMSVRAERDCDDAGETHFEDDRGDAVNGKNRAVIVNQNTAIVSGQGTTLDGTAVQYTAVLQQILGANLYSVSWVTSTGSVFHTSGALTSGYMTIP